MSWPQSPPLVLQTNWVIQDNCCEILTRRLLIGLGYKMIVGSGSILKISA